MNKEQFLAMSLPYSLKCYFDGNSFDIIGIFKTVRLSYKPFGNISVSVNNCKPILHPLTDLKKEITHKGETFVPIEKLREMNDGEIIYIQDDYIGIYNGYVCAYYISDALKFVSVLIEWHFDIAGLIEKGEAIDVNTLPENPYSFKSIK